VPDSPRSSSPNNHSSINTDEIGSHPAVRDSFQTSLVTETAVSDPLQPEELASLRAFFELLARWDSAKGETGDA
jgi:hypothetical protein